MIRDRSFCLIRTRSKIKSCTNKATLEKIFSWAFIEMCRYIGIKVIGVCVGGGGVGGG